MNMAHTIRIRVLSILPLCCMVVMPLAAEESRQTQTTPNEHAHNIDFYIGEAVKRNKGLQAAAANWKAAEARVNSAGKLPDPTLNYTYFVEEVETRVGPQEHKVGVMQRFPWFGKRRLQSDAADAMALAQKAEHDEQLWQLRKNVHLAFADLWYLQKATRITDEHRQLVSAIEAVALTRYRAGSTPHSAVINMQVQLGKLEDTLKSLEQLKTPLEARLKALCYLPDHYEIPGTLQLPRPMLKQSDEDFLEILRGRNPGLTRFDYMEKAAAAKSELAGKARYPDLQFGLEYISTGESMNPNAADSGKDPVMAMISLTIPLQSQKYKAEQTAAEEDRNQAEAMHEQYGISLDAQAQMALYQFRDAERKIELYRDSLIPKARQGMKVAQQEFESAKGGYLEMIDAQRLLLEFQTSLYQAERDRAKAMAELEALAGGCLAQKQSEAQSIDSKADDTSAGRTKNED